MSDYTPTTEEIRSSYPLSDEDKVTHPALAWDRIITVESFDRWLTAHDAETRTATRTAALEEAAVIATAESDDLRYGFTCRSIAHSIRAAKDGAQ